MTTTKAFTKGDLVTKISDWDRKGTVSFRHAIVYSCGKKRMVLTDAVTGEEIGRNFRPQVEQYGFDVVVPRLTDEQAIEAGLAMGAKIVARELHQMEVAIERSGYTPDHGYVRAMRKGIAALHEPRCASYDELSEEVRARVAAEVAARRA